MNVFFINYPLESFTPTQSGALATIIWECCRAAQRRGTTPNVISRRDTVPAFDWPKLILLDYPHLPTNRVAVKLLRAHRRLTGWRHLGHGAYAKRVAAVLDRVAGEKVSLLLMNDPEMAVFLRRRLPKARIVHWFQNQIDCSPRVRREFRHAADAVIAVSDFTGRWIEDYYGFERGSVGTVHNAVDTEQFCPASQPPAGRPVINFVGRTGIEKGPDILLKAASHVARRTSEFDIQIIGSNHWDRFELDDYQRGLADLAAGLERSGVSVRRTGHVGRRGLPEELRRAHIHVVPARWDEPFGMTTVEGMATGLATIAARTGGTPEVVGDAALLFERESVEHLAEHLGNLVTNETLRSDYGRKARARAEEFTWEKTWSQLEKLTAFP